MKSNQVTGIGFRFLHIEDRRIPIHRRNDRVEEMCIRNSHSTRGMHWHVPCVIVEQIHLSQHGYSLSLASPFGSSASFFHALGILSNSPLIVALIIPKSNTFTKTTFSFNSILLSKLLYSMLITISFLVV
ncbi:hypothetical protein PIB30_024520 [Stylosanthes scabra]|uniref:Uncharacterized protein n=1 Tax=Stylosanthes scabra TaxID=79078 RepID=A0ABU6Q9A8_9FABA|nr:hypothetical protein [Stylosanthes scabra]